MRTIHCYICNCNIGRYGWSKHVQKEKRINGIDIFERMKDLRTNRKPKLNIKKENVTLKDFDKRFNYD